MGYPLIYIFLFENLTKGANHLNPLISLCEYFKDCSNVKEGRDTYTLQVLRSQDILFRFIKLLLNSLWRISVLTLLAFFQYCRNKHKIVENFIINCKTKTLTRGVTIVHGLRAVYTSVRLLI